MKRSLFVIIAIALLAQACRKSGTGLTAAQSTLITYADINGRYILADSTYFAGLEAFEPTRYQIKTTLGREVFFTVDANTVPKASVKYNGQIYYESSSVNGEFITEDKYFDIQKIIFSRGGKVFINYVRQEFGNDSVLNITVTGNKQ